MEILERFGRIAGQQLKLNKSFVKFSPLMSREHKENFKVDFSMPQVNQMDNHLGVPIDIQGKKAGSFQFLVDKVTKYFELDYSSFFPTS